MKTKILICGSTGFIGRNLVSVLTKNDSFEVYGTCLNSEPPENPALTTMRVDMTKKDDVMRAVEGMDIVVQAAATTSGAKDIVTKPYIHVTDNAIMNALLFRAAFECGVRHVVFLSCTTMYQSGEVPVKESDFDANQQMYPSYFGGAWTKVYNEKMCEFYSRIGSARYTVIRHSNIYGPYDKFDLEKSHVFGATVTKVMTTPDNGKVIVWGSGEEERDLLYVSDLVDLIGRVIDRQDSAFELINAGCGRSISIRDLVQKIITHSGRNLDIEFDLSKPTLKTKLCLDTTKAKTLFAWHAQTSIDEGIRRTLEWYASHIATQDSGK